MRFQPSRVPGSALGFGLAFWCVVFGALLLVRGLTLDVSLTVLGCYVVAALLFALALLFAYWGYCCFSLRYDVDRNGLTIHWGFLRQVVPLGSVERVVVGKPGLTPSIKGVSWPGYRVGRGSVEGIGDVLFYSTHRLPEDIVYIVTATQAYAVSPPDVHGFVTAVDVKRHEGAKVALRQMPRRPFFADQPFLLDRYAQLLALAAVFVFVLMCGVVFARYGSLDETLALSFPPLDVTRVGAKSELLSLPTTALGVMLVSLPLAFALRMWERVASYLLLAGLIGVQGVFLWGAIVAVS